MLPVVVTVRPMHPGIQNSLYIHPASRPPRTPMPPTTALGLGWLQDKRGKVPYAHPASRYSPVHAYWLATGRGQNKFQGQSRVGRARVLLSASGRSDG